MSHAIKDCYVAIMRHSHIDTMGFKKKYGVKKYILVVLERNSLIDDKARALQFDFQLDFPAACEHENNPEFSMYENEVSDNETRLGVKLTIQNPGFHAYARRWRDWERFQDEGDRLELKREQKRKNERARRRKNSKL